MSRRREVHRGLALALEVTIPSGGEPADPGEIARHAEQGGERAMAYRYATMAAAACEARFAYEEALTWLDLAAGVGERRGGYRCGESDDCAAARAGGLARDADAAVAAVKAGGLGGDGLRSAGAGLRLTPSRVRRRSPGARSAVRHRPGRRRCAAGT